MLMENVDLSQLWNIFNQVTVCLPAKIYLIIFTIMKYVIYHIKALKKDL